MLEARWAWVALASALVGRRAAGGWRRLGLTALGIAMGVAVAVAIQSANGRALEAFARGVDEVAGPGAHRLQLASGGFPEAQLGRLAPWLDAWHVLPVVRGPLRLRGELVKVLGLDLIAAAGLPAHPALAAAKAQGGFISGAWLGPALAQRQGLAAGDRLEAQAPGGPVRLRVAGLLPPGPGLDPDGLYVDLAYAQEWFGKLGRLDEVALVPRSGLDPQPWLAAHPLPAGWILSPPADLRREGEKATAAFRMNLSALALVALLVGGYLVHQALAVGVAQRRPAIAMLRALGASRAQVVGLVGLEALAVGLVGSALGLALGLGLAELASAAVGQTVQGLYGDVGFGGLGSGPGPALTGAVGGLVVSLLAALWPAWQASLVPPALGARSGSAENEAPPAAWRLGLAALATGALAAWLASWPAWGIVPVGGYAAAALVLVAGSLLAMPAVQALAWLAEALAPSQGAWPWLVARPVGRAAVMVGVTITLGMATMIHGFRHSLSQWLDHTLPAAFYLKSELAEGARQGLRLPPGLAAEAEKLPGVEEVEAFFVGQARINGETWRLGVPEGERLARLGHLKLADGGETGPALRRMAQGEPLALISEPTATRLGLAVGDELRWESPHGLQRLGVAGIFKEFGTEGPYLMIEAGRYRAATGELPCSDLAIYLASGAAPEQVRRALLELVGEAPVSVRASAGLRQAALEVFDRTFAITRLAQAAALALGLLGVGTALIQQVLERQHEWRTLRRLGLPLGRLRAAIVGEAALVGLAGALLGAGAGYALAWLLVAVINRQAFGWQVALLVPWGTWACVLAVVPAAAALAGALPAHLALQEAQAPEASRD